MAACFDRTFSFSKNAGLQRFQTVNTYPNDVYSSLTTSTYPNFEVSSKVCNLTCASAKSQLSKLCHCSYIDHTKNADCLNAQREITGKGFTVCIAVNSSPQAMV